MTGEERRQSVEHLKQLAKQHRIHINWRDKNWRGFEAHVSTRQVFIRKPHTYLDYLGALHELGHIVSRTARRALVTERAAIEEAAAWEWALIHFPWGKRLGSRDWLSLGKAWASHLAYHHGGRRWFPD